MTGSAGSGSAADSARAWRGGTASRTTSAKEPAQRSATARNSVGGRRREHRYVRRRPVPERPIGRRARWRPAGTAPRRRSADRRSGPGPASPAAPRRPARPGPGSRTADPDVAAASRRRPGPPADARRLGGCRGRPGGSSAGWSPAVAPAARGAAADCAVPRPKPGRLGASDGSSAHPSCLPAAADVSVPRTQIAARTHADLRRIVWIRAARRRALEELSPGRAWPAARPGRSSPR